jgi:hypothetical protein
MLRLWFMFTFFQNFVILYSFHSKFSTLRSRSRMFLRTIGKQKSVVSYYLKANFTYFHNTNQKSKPSENKIVIDFKKLNHPTKVPLVPCASQTLEPIADVSSKITDDIIQLLQRLSLVDLDSK